MLPQRPEFIEVSNFINTKCGIQEVGKDPNAAKKDAHKTLEDKHKAMVFVNLMNSLLESHKQLLKDRQNQCNKLSYPWKDIQKISYNMPDLPNDIKKELEYLTDQCITA